jgi:uncharacterized protein (DUF169 family)/NAD-dependent dihydropyrimidine dehydrogenase PreA subunit
MVSIEIDEARCNGCNFCVGFCPTSVFDLVNISGRKVAKANRPQDCWACMACAGQCPEWAITITQDKPPKRYIDDGNDRPFVPLDVEEIQTYKRYSEVLEGILKLRSKPVAVTLILKGDPLPHVPVPRIRLRYCQSLIIARRGKSILMPPDSHSCADGTSILGLTKIPAKLATGDVYLKLGKLASREAAETLVRERPTLPEESVRATLVTSLENAVMKPDVVVIMAPPESMMWLCMASTFYTGKRMTFKMSSYNAQCVETTLYPRESGEINMSLGCYGCRTCSDLGEDIMFMGIPMAKMPSLIDGLEHLGKKAIPDSRSKLYLPPLI